MIFKNFQKSFEDAFGQHLVTKEEISCVLSNLPYLVMELRSQLDDEILPVIILPDEKMLELVKNDLEVFLGKDCCLNFPSRGISTLEEISPPKSVMGARNKFYYDIKKARLNRKILLITYRSACEKIYKNQINPGVLNLNVGENFGFDHLIKCLSHLGFLRQEEAQYCGEFAVRGGIIDVVSAPYEFGIRIDFFGNEIETIKKYNLENQRSYEQVSSIELFAPREVFPKKVPQSIRKRYQELTHIWNKFDNLELFEGMEGFAPIIWNNPFSVLDLISSSGIFYLVAPDLIKQNASRDLTDESLRVSIFSKLWDRNNKIPPILFNFEDLEKKFKFRRIFINQGSAVKTSFEKFLPVKPEPSVFLDQIKDLVSQDYSVIIAATDNDFLKGIGDDHLEETIDLNRLRGLVLRIKVKINFGGIYKRAKVAIVTPYELGIKDTLPSTRKAPPKFRASLEDIEKGSYVVHRFHGIGIYQGLVRLENFGVEKDYIKLQYKNGDELFVSVDESDCLTIYRGNDRPAISRLGGADWERSTSKVRSEIAKIAIELVELYSKRAKVERPPYDVTNPFLRELADSFDYVETRDQKKAIEDIFRDMSSTKPMDRLICGDVGFGKTEVALRSAFLAVVNSRQVVIIVPTAILAQQHFDTFTRRLFQFPVNISVLSRFSSSKQRDEIMKGVKEGYIDIVIATHAILNEKIKFKNLGLVIIDEEQRFGVSHKEFLKQINPEVDVLSLSANPIPRTLEMALTSLRDMSLIRTPPLNRNPIYTYVGQYDERLIKEAIIKELLRGGQVFYVYNKVKGILDVKERISKLIPEASLGVAHGQLSSDALERAVSKFLNREYDILLSTTIIESGLDIPNVNTLIVEEAQKLGLGQLHQLRGRVGRSNEQAYAYFFYSQDSEISSKAFERLKTIGEEFELGSGFNISMKDLEIRGAGTFLGKLQSGHISKVGYDLYIQMVSEAISQLKGEKVKLQRPIRLDLGINAFIRDNYIDSEAIRIDIYKRLASVGNLDELLEIKDELQDRFGPFDLPIENLFKIATIKYYAKELNISSIILRQKMLTPNYYNTMTREFVITPKHALRARVPHVEVRFTKNDAVFDVDPEKNICDQLIEFLSNVLEKNYADSK